MLDFHQPARFVQCSRSQIPGAHGEGAHSNGLCFVCDDLRSGAGNRDVPNFYNPRRAYFSFTGHFAAARSAVM